MRVSLTLFLFGSLAAWPCEGLAVPLLGTIAPQGERTSETGPQPAAVELTLVASEPDPVLIERVASWFPNDSTVTGTFRESIKSSSVVGATAPDSIGIWVFLEEGRSLVFFATHRDGQHRYFRKVVDGPLDEQGSETLAQLIHYSALALWEGSVATSQAEIESSLASMSSVTAMPAAPTAQPEAASTVDLSSSVAEGPAETTATTASSSLAEPSPVDPDSSMNSESRAAPEPVPPLAPKLLFAASLGYGANFRTGEGSAHGPEASLGLPVGSMAWIRLSGRWLVPAQFSVASSRLEATGARLRLLVQLPLLSDDLWRLHLLAGGGIDVVKWRVVETELSGPGAETDTRPVLSGSLALERSWAQWVLGVRGVLDYSLANTRYLQIIDGEDDVAGEPSPWAPGIALSVGYYSDFL